MEQHQLLQVAVAAFMPILGMTPPHRPQLLLQTCVTDIPILLLLVILEDVLKQDLSCLLP